MNQPLQAPPSSVNWADSPLLAGQTPVASAGLRVFFEWKHQRVASASPLEKDRNVTLVEVTIRILADPNAVMKHTVTPEEAAQRWPVEWAFFESDAEKPAHGTPLSELPDMTRSLISNIHSLGLFTVEDVLEVDPHIMAENGRHAMRCRALAQAWVDRQRDQADVVEVAQYRDAAETANVQLAKAMDQIKNLQAQIDAMSAIMPVAAQHTGAGVQALPTEDYPEVPVDQMSDLDAMLSGSSSFNGDPESG